MSYVAPRKFRVLDFGSLAHFVQMARRDHEEGP